MEYAKEGCAQSAWKDKVSGVEGLAKEVSVNGLQAEVREKIIRDMADMLRCRTVSHRDEKQIQREEFAGFINLLEERFPLVHTRSARSRIGKTGLLYRWKGRNANQPIVLMSHYDVVPVVEEAWSRDPFGGEIAEGCIWGRGALDTKGTLCGILEAAEWLMGCGFVPEHDFYFSFSGEEEIDGSSCAEIVEHLEKKGIKPSMVLDEGGAVVEGALPGIPGECAMIGIAEKGSVSLDISLSGEGGHASTPPVHTLAGELARAIVRLEKHPFPARLTPAVEKMFLQAGKSAGGVVGMIFRNIRKFWFLLGAASGRLGTEINAMSRTTCAITRMEGSPSYNVLPAKCSFGVNLRLISGDTIDSAVSYLHRILQNDRLSIQVVGGMNPSIVSDTECEAWRILCDTVRETWENALPVPYLMMACSDSRHYCRITDRVYRFSAMKLSREERGMIHGNDERIPIDTLIRTVEFYIRLMKKL